MTYKIQNRSPDNKRIKLIKRSDGRVTFVGNPIPTYQENTIQAGWCMAAITPVPELIDPQTTFELTAAPMGVDGRVSIYRNGTLVSSMRYNDLNSNTAKVKWFNDFFGAVVLMAIIKGITVFTIREDDSVVTLIFEDDDIDYIENNFGPAAPNRTAFFREQYRLAVGLKLTEIDCTGAIDWAGILTFDDQVEGSVNNSGGTEDFSDTDGMIAGLEAKGFTVIPLNDWVPRPPDVAYPRLSIGFMSESEASLTEPTTLTVELTDKLGRKTVYRGPISQVMDSCREKGILLRINQDQFQIGTEPYTPFTKVKATFTDRQFNPEISEDWMYSNWVNPTLVVSNNNHTLDANFGWEPLSRFWCFTYFQTIGANGNAGDVLSYPDIDYRVAGTLEESQRNVTVNTDFTETCAWNTQYPVLCRQLNQMAEAEGVINERLAGLGGKIFDFNQSPVWGPEGTIGYITEIDNYRPTAVKWTSGSYTYGYSIPEPEMPM